MEIDHKDTHKIVCPWCGRKAINSWEQGDSGDDVVCEGCWNTYDYERDVKISYSTSRKDKYIPEPGDDLPPNKRRRA